MNTRIRIASSVIVALLWTHTYQGDATIYFDGKRQNLVYEGAAWKVNNGVLEGSGVGNKLYAAEALAEGDFLVQFKLMVPEFKSGDSAAALGENYFGFDGQGKTIFVNGPWFGGKWIPLGESAKFLPARKNFDVEIRRVGGTLTFSIDRQVLHTAEVGNAAVGRVGLVPHRGSLRLYHFSITGKLVSPNRASEAERAKQQPSIDNAIDRGVSYLLSTQMRDGSWGGYFGMYPGGQTALSLYTLLKSDYAPQHPALQRGFAFLDTIQPAETYTLACFLLAYGATHDAARKPRIQSLTDSLLSWTVKGRWSYPNNHQGDHFGEVPGIPDLSNTQFAALGLWAAVRAGVDVNTDRWREILDATLAYQEKPAETDVPLETGTTATGRAYVGGFGYRPRDLPTGSMTCAGIGVLKIVQQCAGARLPKPVSKQVDNAVDAAVGWLKANYTVTANPKKSDWTNYYLYGLERACALTRLDTLAGHDWYFEGAQYLVDKQKTDGSWSDGNSEPDTCFAILFLRRATGAVTTGGIDNTRSAEVHVSEDPADSVWLRATGRSHLTLWISGFGEGANPARGGQSPDGSKQGPRVVSVEYLVNTKPVARIEGNPRKPWTGERYGSSHAFLSRGEYQVGVKVTVVSQSAPPGESSPTLTLFAKGFTVNVDSVLEPWMLDWSRHRRTNLLTGMDLTVTTTSQLSAGEGFDKATDGVESTRWLCAKTDASPAIAFELVTPVKADTITLGPCCMKDESRGIFDKIREAEVRVNKDKTTISVIFDADEFRPAFVTLPKVTAVKSIEVRITRRDRGGSVPGSTGFSEIGLELRGK